ncbi:hypothetical protein POM88_020603 [Heracleum sosnowskyi]|uniref:Uncharacterized protein n=1 Tax=Heracleum sosnowskyi TaxID=360622 RepID=A0AAD8ICY7_9APIA|nr:hypothetical protein POM88_020603 [Heracleum sosnowskyi]
MKNDESSPSLMNLLMGVKGLQHAIIALLLDIMVEIFQPPKGFSNDNSSEVTTKRSSDDTGSNTPWESDWGSGVVEPVHLVVNDRLDAGMDKNIHSSNLGCFFL